MSERWGIWCEHADGRRYWLGDSTQTRWHRADAERIVRYLSAHPAPDDASYEVRPFPPKLNPDAEGRASASEDALPDTYRPVTELLNRLWTRAVGTPDYVKADWRRFESWIEAMWRASGRSTRLEPVREGRASGVVWGCRFCGTFNPDVRANCPSCGKPMTLADGSAPATVPPCILCLDEAEARADARRNFHLGLDTLCPKHHEEFLEWRATAKGRGT